MSNRIIITKANILATVDIQDVSEKQRRINEMVVAFANNVAHFESSECWSEYYELVQKKTNVSHELRKKAFFNAYDSQMRNNGR